MVVSCAEPPLEIVAVKEPEPPKSKPVKIPVGTEDKGSYAGIAIDEFFSIQQSGNALIYDVRVAYFFQKDHIPGAVNWPYTKFEEQIQQRDIEIQEAQNAGKEVVLYCFNLGCPEARNVAKKLTRRGYSLKVFSSGIDTWRDAGLPME